MSESKTRSFTMRLSPEDQVALAQLCDLYGLDRPASIRQAIQQALAQHTAVPSEGYFIPVGPVRSTGFPVHLNRKSTRE
jgi:hypothetical protein